AQDIGLGPSTKAIVKAATARGIPYRRLNQGSLIQFGYGSKQRRILASETDRTTAIAESIAQDKNLTRELLAGIGVPVPERRPVESAQDAWQAAEESGVPVVVNAQDGKQGRGGRTNLARKEQGLPPESVPAAGQRVVIRRNANVSTGGTAVDVTDRVHSDWVTQAVAAARMIGLDVAGIDVVAIDISQPCEPGTGAIVEV